MISQIIPLTEDFEIGSLVATAYVVFAITAMIPIIRKRKQGVQSLNKSFMIWMVFMLGMTMIRFSEYIMIINQGVPEGSFSIGALLSTWYLIPMLSIMAELQFVLYILRKYKFYSIPVILTFFVSLGLFQYDTIAAYDMVMLPIAFITPNLFMWKGKGNRDGLTFSIGVFSLFDYGIAYTINSIMKYALNFSGVILYLPLLFSALFAVFYLNLGTWGWLDRHVFYDKQREKQIKNAWVSRLIEIEKRKPEVKKTEGKFVLLECPICHQQGRKQFAHEVVLERAKNEKGIVKILLNQEKEICEHQFVAYVDRSFSIRGYETIDMMA
jgi:hypothetical protein